jgi:predicted nucleic acid-binding protein
MSTFRNPYFTPTNEQAALVGHIVMDCAILEFNLAALVSRLALMPDLLGRAVLGEGTASGLEDRAKRLLQVHAQRYEDKLIPYDHRLAIEAALRQARSVRKHRNAFAHHISFREDDDSVAFFALSRMVLLTDNHHRRETLASLRALREEVRAANNALEAVITLIPGQPERWAKQPEANANGSA